MRYYHHFEGMIAQHENRDSVAVENFTKANSLLPYQHEALDDHAFYFHSLALSYMKMNQQNQALEQFEKILGLTTGRVQWGDLYAKSLYWLGKIHQKKGQNQKALENYDKFLELWKKADPMIQEIEDVKKLIPQLNENQNRHPITAQN